MWKTIQEMKICGLDKTSFVTRATARGRCDRCRFLHDSRFAYNLAVITVGTIRSAVRGPRWRFFVQCVVLSATALTVIATSVVGNVMSEGARGVTSSNDDSPTRFVFAKAGKAFLISFCVLVPLIGGLAVYGLFTDEGPFDPMYVIALLFFVPMYAATLSGVIAIVYSMAKLAGAMTLGQSAGDSLGIVVAIIFVAVVVLIGFLMLAGGI